MAEGIAALVGLCLRAFDMAIMAFYSHHEYTTNEPITCIYIYMTHSVPISSIIKNRHDRHIYKIHIASSRRSSDLVFWVVLNGIGLDWR
jgi:hypothetical protein